MNIQPGTYLTVVDEYKMEPYCVAEVVSDSAGNVVFATQMVDIQGKLRTLSEVKGQRVTRVLPIEDADSFSLYPGFTWFKQGSDGKWEYGFDGTDGAFYPAGDYVSVGEAFKGDFMHTMYHSENLSEDLDAVNVNAIRQEDFWHATTRANWFEGIQGVKDDPCSSLEGTLMVHAGTFDAALERMWSEKFTSIHRTEALKGKVYFHRVRITEDARICPVVVKDGEDYWYEVHDETLHNGKDVFVYQNAVEDYGSASIYVRADRIEVVETVEFDAADMGFTSAKPQGYAENYARLVTAA